MPPTEEILRQLAAAANDARLVAVGWHALVLAAATAILVRRPPRRLVALALVGPCASVAAVAIRHGNPFNGIAFALLSAALLALVARVPRGPVEAGPTWCRAAGLALVAFGLVYPHFLVVDSALEFLWAAPIGVVPCPTLALLVGALLVLDGLGSRAFALIVAGSGAFYGLFGALRLGVRIDALLLAGALLLGWRALRRESTARPR